MSDLVIVSGRSNETLAKNIASSLGKSLSPVVIRNFSDGEIWMKYEENIRGKDLFIIQSTNAPAENFLELLIMIDAAKRASAKRITAVIPYFAYARQDRKDQPRVSITAKLFANLLTEAGADRVITMDLHTPQIQGFFDIPLDHLYGSTVLVNKLFELRSENLAIASPDVGGIKTARTYAKVLGADLVVVDKRRPTHNVAEVMNIIGEVSGKDIIVIDDLIDTGITFVKCSEALLNAGAKSITGVCTHAVFSGSAIEKINQSDAIKTVYVTDTFPTHWETSKIVTVSVAELFGEAIERTHNNASISSLFDIIR